MICHKLSLSENISREINAFSNRVNSAFLEIQTLPPNAAYWSLEETGWHSIITQRREGRMSGNNVLPLSSLTWKKMCAMHHWFEPFFKKFKLQGFFGSVLNPNFETHRHASLGANGMSNWVMAVIGDVGTFQIVEPVDSSIVKNPNYGQDPNDSSIWNMYEELPDETELRILESHEVKPGDIFVFDGWLFHQFFSGPNPRSTMFWADKVTSESQALKFIEYMESL